MANGHPCPSCGWTLRWVPEQNAWGCDRCRTVIPAGPAPAQPQQPMSGLAQPGVQRPVATAIGGSFGGSASTAAPRSQSQPPGVYTANAPAAQPQPGYAAANAPAAQPQPGYAAANAPPAYATPPQQQRPQSASQPNYSYGQAPSPQAQPPNPYAAAYGNAAGDPYAQQPYPAQAPNPAASDPYGQRAPSHADPRAASQPGAPGYGPGGYPMVSSTPAASGPAEAAAAPRKRGKGLLIALVAVGAIGVGVTVAVLLSGGSKATGGMASRDEVARDTLTALTAGDVDRLVALVAFDSAETFLDCTEEAKQERGAPEKALEKLREGLTKQVEKAKGLEVELVKLSDGKPQTLKKGEAAGKGCTMTTDVSMYDLDATLKIKHAAKPARERVLKISMAEAEGRWFLVSAPSVEAPGDCAAAAKTSVAGKEAEWKKSSLGDSAKARLEKAMAQHCTDDKWSDAAILCIENAKGSDAKCLAELTEAQRAGLRKKFEQIVAEDVKSREVPVVAETPPPVDPTIDPTVDPTVAPSAGSGSGAGSAAPEGPEPIPPICDEYKEQIAKIARCRRIKASVKKGLREDYALVVEGWNKVVKKTDAIRTSTQDICKKGVDQLVDLRKSLCR